jgi:hypothetical protein
MAVELQRRKSGMVVKGEHGFEILQMQFALKTSVIFLSSDHVEERPAR